MTLDDTIARIMFRYYREQAAESGPGWQEAFAKLWKLSPERLAMLESEYQCEQILLCPPHDHPVKNA